MPGLVEVSDLRTRLGEEANAFESGLLTSVLDSVEALFVAACGRADRPFCEEDTEDRTEVFDGNGRRELFLGYPVASLTSVALGRNPNSPDETLDVSDTDVLLWEIGSRRLDRVDGGLFGCRGAPRAVRVTYRAAEDLPPAAHAAIIAGAIFVLRRMGAEDQRSERIGGFYADLLHDFEADPVWKAGLGACMEAVV